MPTVRVRTLALLACTLALLLSVATAAGTVWAQTSLTVDHYVTHFSTVPAITGEPVQLFVRERLAASRSVLAAPEGRVVLFVHGATYPAVHGFDLPLDDYSWMAFLADAGFDVFAMDM